MDAGKERSGAKTAPTLTERAANRPPRTARPRRPGPQPSPVTGRISPSAAALSRPLLVLLPVLTFLAPALLVALAKQPVHTSEARLLVGGFDVEAQAVPGFVEASRTLASTYARLVTTPAVLDLVAEQLDMDADDLDGHVDATSVPESSIIRIEGMASSPRQATRYADAAAEALLQYASSTGAATNADDVLEEYESAAADNAAAQAALAEVERAVTAAAAPSAELRAQQAAARATADAASLRASTIAERYSLVQRNAGGTGQVRLVAPASYSGDDRRSTLQIAIAASLGLGLVAGIALATIVVNARTQERGGATSRND